MIGGESITLIMPFTFSHAAVVLPFGYLPKRLVSMTGLIFGSIAPDFEYFIRMNFSSFYSHSWLGLFWFNLPISIILTFIFHSMVRSSLIDNLPILFRQHLVAFKKFNWNIHFKENWLVILVSIIIGSTTHILWDGFTHREGYFVQSFDVLQKEFLIWGNHIPVYKVLQHGSTLIGLLVIIFTILKLPKQKLATKRKSVYPFWFSIVIISFLIVFIRRLTDPFLFNNYPNLLVTIITGSLIGLLVAAKLFTQMSPSRKISES